MRTKRKFAKINLKLRKQEIFQSYAMIGLSVAGLALFVVYPLLWALRWCLYNYSGIGEPRYIGFANFANAFSEGGQRYWQSVGNTFVFAFGKLLIELPLALFLAYILSDKLKGRSFFRTIFYLPGMLSMAVIGIVFFYIFGSYNGVVNSILNAIGLKSILWFSEGGTAMFVMMLASIWQNFGLNMLFFMTGLQSIPADIYDSAAIDGASATRRFFSITLPMLAPVAQMIILNALLGSLKTAELVLAMTNGAPNGKTEFMMSYIYKQFFSSTMLGTSNNYGFASALVLITSIIMGIVTVIYLYVTKKGSELYE